MHDGRSCLIPPGQCNTVCTDYATAVLRPRAPPAAPVTPRNNHAKGRTQCSRPSRARLRQLHHWLEQYRTDGEGRQRRACQVLAGDYAGASMTADPLNCLHASLLLLPGFLRSFRGTCEARWREVYDRQSCLPTCWAQHDADAENSLSSRVPSLSLKC